MFPGPYFYSLFLVNFYQGRRVAKMLTLWGIEGKKYVHITNIYRPKVLTSCTPTLYTPFLLSLYLQHHPRKKFCKWIVKKSSYHGRNVPIMTRHNVREKTQCVRSKICMTSHYSRQNDTDNSHL